MLATSNSPSGSKPSNDIFLSIIIVILIIFLIFICLPVLIKIIVFTILIKEKRRDDIIVLKFLQEHLLHKSFYLIFVVLLAKWQFMTRSAIGHEDIV